MIINDLNNNQSIPPLGYGNDLKVVLQNEMTFFLKLLSFMISVKFQFYLYEIIICV